MQQVEVSGACVILRSHALKMGLFDEDYFIYTEEVDLSYRFMRARYAILGSTGKVVHFGGQVSNRFRTRCSCYFTVPRSYSSASITVTW
jgi:GT2 family glycosyltransferase